MNRTRTLLAMIGVFGMASWAQAQPPGYRPPNSSPSYGWLGRGTPAQRYLTNVRPQQYAQDAFQQLHQQFDAFGRSVAATEQNDLTAEGIRPTGRGATFMNYGHYYPRLGGLGPRGAPPRR